MIAVHVTHEAVEKMGGIGAVIDGLATCPAYGARFSRTLLVGPLLETDRPADQRCGRGGKVQYSSLDGIDTGGWSNRFKPIEQTYGVGIIYGTRRLTNGPARQQTEVEVLLVDVFRFNRDRLNLFKGELYAKFGVPSDEFESIWEFEQYVRLAEPAYEAVHAIGCRGTPGEPLVLFAHEYMGLPLALKSVLAGASAERTVFYAHEVASARRVVETHEGHDLMFYNLLAECQKHRRSLEDCFPEIRRFFKHPLIKAAAHCDAVFAVGDLVGQEMRFLDPAFQNVPVEMVYNGVPARRQTFPERRNHRAAMRRYAGILCGKEPEFIMTHVARPVMSKGIWRDLRVLHELDGPLGRAGRSAVYVLLGTLAGQRRTKDVLQMERVYGWPMHHMRGYPDLCNGEEMLGAMFEDFNRHHEAVRVVLVNQFGWERRLCGMRMPEDMTFDDIRCGTDVEFGLSVYEPFGISQLEPLGFGAICAVSSVCGCVAFARRCAGGQLPVNILEADFTALPGRIDPAGLKGIGRAARDLVEDAECHRIAGELLKRLPTGEAQLEALLDSGWQLGQQITWERVVEALFLPAVAEVCRLDALDAPAK